MSDLPVHDSSTLHDIPKKQNRGLNRILRPLLARARALIGARSIDNMVEGKDAVAHFLREMEAVAARTYPKWSGTLNARLSECSLRFEDQHAIIDRHPTDDYYFAGVVALEAARMRGIYPPQEADQILGEIGDQVDRVAGRKDRVVSDLVFYILGRIELGAGVDRMKTPHDKAVKAILEHMGFKKNDTTREIMTDAGFRHLLGEPLAVWVPRWWQAFHEQFTLHWSAPEPESNPKDDDNGPSLEPRARTLTTRRWRGKRSASSLMDR